MIKSNINDWIVCQPNGGSMVTIKHGSISCQNIKVYSWVSCDVIIFSGGQLEIETSSWERIKCSLYVLASCFVANMCNFL